MGSEHVTFGIEKAFLNDRFSVEFRIRLVQLNSEQNLTTPTRWRPNLAT